MKAVIFDLGHTLIDYHSDWKEPEAWAVSRTYKLIEGRKGRVPRESDFMEELHRLLEAARQKRKREMVEVPLESILEECLHRFECEHDPGLMERSLEIFYEALLEHRRLIVGVREMLTALDGKYSLGLISDVAWGLPSHFPLRDMRHYAIDRFFDDMVFSTDVGLRKPNPRIFEISLKKLGVRKEEAIYIGNSLQADIRGAMSAGIRSVLKRSKYYFPDESIVPDASIDDWSNLGSVLSSLR